MKQLLIVFIGGGIGSVARFLISKTFNNTQTPLPLGTFTVNILGSFLIGLILGYFAKNQTISQSYTLLLATGFCGGFTTFSSFAFENQTLLKAGDFTSFALYTIGSIIFGFLAVFAGIYLVKFT